MPPGMDPNDDVSHLVYIPSAVFVVLCPVLVAMRMWARLRRGGKTGVDDWICIAALIFTLLTAGFLVASCQNGMGRHWLSLNPMEKFESMKYFYMAQISYKAAINLTKCSIILLYLRIFNKIRWFKWACWFILACVAMYMAGSVLVTIFQCRPIRAAFDKTITDKVCVNNTQFWYANAGFSISTDVIILLLPMPLVYQLQVPWPQKAALTGVFALGIFVVITSCLRITTLDILAETPDQTYDIENVMWTIIEPNVAVVCACLPILRPFIVKLIPALKSKASYARYGGGARGASSYGYGSSKSRAATANASQSRDKADWVEIGGAKSDAMHMTAIQRSGSTAGSEDSILNQRGPQTVGPANSQTAGGPVVDQGGDGIHKTVEYSIEYENRK
ncbi:hypothetical protein N3K66_000420 [Trichothecium roseum]|uniref:Uncharacterized protein n=1 Tax=Trichothecium roseum TaxID=47278 RepID=A0ACC0VDC9_9HYPO|nr:hypothetical protein N3K66_000420 [Trichothecium roseum]